MQTTCVRHTALPHTSMLFADFSYGFDRVARYYAYSPHSEESFRRAAAQIDYPAKRRAALVSLLREQNGESAALDRLSRPDTLAVVTGQQAGLFAGPCYTIYKALTAIRLARRLTETGIPAVPVFWLATEDHDFAEVNHVWVFDARLRPVRLEIPGSDAAMQPVGTIRIETSPVAALREALAGFPFGAETAEVAGRAYAPGETFGTAFAKLLRQVLDGQELLYLDPMAAGARELAAPLLRDAALAAPELSERIFERDRDLAAAGYHAQVHFEERTSLFFLLENGQRVPLSRRGREYTAGSRRFSTEELAGRAAELSPNALLRPVAQDYMLPTVAHVGGPAEIAYLAQSRVLYDTLLGRAPVEVHRQSATLIDARAAKLMDRYGLEFADVLRGQEWLAGRIAAHLVPREIEEAFNGAKTVSAAAFDELAHTLASFDPTLVNAFATSRRKIAYQLSKIERKAAREALRRDQNAADGAAYLDNLIYPQKHLQERFYSILPFIARYGPALIARLVEEIDLDSPDHRLIVV